MITSHRRARRVLVCGDDPRMTLSIARSLGRQGVIVDIACSGFGEPFRRSRYVNQIHLVPRTHAPDRAWSDAIIDLLESHSFDLCLPTGEEVACVLHHEHERLSAAGRWWMHPAEMFPVLVDKVRMLEIAQEVDLPLPQSGHARTREEVHSFVETMDGSVVLKPAQSVDRSITGKAFVRIAADQAEALDVADELLAASGAVVLQEYVPGYGVGVEFLAENGEILTAFQHRRLHETTGQGSTYRIGEDVDPRLREATARLISAVDYTGVGMCEFRVDPDSNRFIFVELNPRFWGSLPLAVASGADFPWFLTQLLLDGVTEFPQTFRTGLRCRSLRSDVRWTWRAWKNACGDHAAITAQDVGWLTNRVSLPRLTVDTLRLLSCRDRCDSFAWDDPLPVFAEALNLFRKPASDMRPSAPKLLNQASPKPVTSSLEMSESARP